MSANELTLAIAKIQQAQGKQRTALIAQARATWTGHNWSNPDLRQWALWNWREAGL